MLTIQIQSNDITVLYAEAVNCGEHGERNSFGERNLYRCTLMTPDGKDQFEVYHTHDQGANVLTQKILETAEKRNPSHTNELLSSKEAVVSGHMQLVQVSLPFRANYVIGNERELYAVSLDIVRRIQQEGLFDDYPETDSSYKQLEPAVHALPDGEVKDTVLSFLDSFRTQTEFRTMMQRHVQQAVAALQEQDGEAAWNFLQTYPVVKVEIVECNRPETIL